MNGEMSFGNGAGKMKAILRAAGIAAFAAFFCVGCGDNSTGGGGGQEEPASTYTITFDANGGMIMPNSGATGTDGTLASLPLPTRGGYTFDGWFTAKTDGEAVTESTVFGNDATIYAQWTLNIYKITFDANGGTVTPDTGTTGEGWKLASLPTPTRGGYTFSGWFTAATGGTMVTKDSVFSKADTIYAQWTLNVYKITFDSKSGGAVDSQNIGYGGKVTAPNPAPTRTGYAFGGWYRDTVYNASWNFAADTVTSAITLYAKWTLNTYKVTFNSQNSAIDSQSVEHGNKATAPTTITRTGYTLVGWFKDSTYTAAWDFAATTITSDTTLYAKWTINKYTVKFVDYNETVIKLDTVNYNTGAAAPASPTRTGYTFKNWDKAYNAVTENLTVTAVYEINTYIVKFVDHDGTTVLKLDTVNYNTGATAPTPTRTGYTFKNWDKAFSAVTDTLTVKAVYEINTYIVKFVDHDGITVLKLDTVDYNSGATAPASPTRTGYTFKNWDKAFSAITNTLTVKAVYEINIYMVTFEANGGEVNPASDTTGDGWKLASLPTPTKDGYGFNGWYTEETGGTKVTTSTVFNADAAIYAQWFISYTITFNANGGEVTPETGMTNIDKRLVPLPTPTKNGYFFTGWYTEETGGTKVTTSTVFSANATIYAQWLGTTFTDSRDGQTYRRVIIGTQVWMAQNLNYNVPDVTTDVCYGDNSSNCAKYGRLYNWSTAMTACPVGWHLPSDAEWTTLINYVGGEDIAGGKLKSTSGWSSGHNGTDDYGFSALPGGYRILSFGGADLYGRWWSATENGTSLAWDRSVAVISDIVLRNTREKQNLLSVRCVQD